MSRINKFQEGHGPPKESWSTLPAKKRKNRVRKKKVKNESHSRRPEK